MTEIIECRARRLLMVLAIGAIAGLLAGCFPAIRIPHTTIHELHILLDGMPLVVKSRGHCSSGMAVLSSLDMKLHSQWTREGANDHVRVQVAPGVVLHYPLYVVCGLSDAIEMRNYFLWLGVSSDISDEVPAERVPIQFVTETRNEPLIPNPNRPDIQYPGRTWEIVVLRTKEIAFGGHTIKFVKEVSRPLAQGDEDAEFRGSESKGAH